jgi:hypothetical protein
MGQPTRQSIEPTYDHRQTGDRFTVAYLVNGRRINEESITDPFVRGRVTVSWRDIVRSLLRRRRLEVEFRVDGDRDIIEDIMELDANYRGIYDSTRRQQANAEIEHALERLAMTPDGEELN